jgi:hypothetical protein
VSGQRRGDALVGLLERGGRAGSAGVAVVALLLFGVVATADAATVSRAKDAVSPTANGRITDLRANGNGFDLNRDFITLTQPETVATVKQIKMHHPVTFLDLHG